MPRPPLAATDSLDDRREIVRALDALSPAARYAFVRARCRESAGPGAAPRHSFYAPLVESARRGCGRASDALTVAAYGDLVLLASQYGLDLGRAAQALESLARRA